MNKFKVWLDLHEETLKISTNKLCMILNDLDTNAVAIKGGNMYPITYSLAAAVMFQNECNRNGTPRGLQN